MKFEEIVEEWKEDCKIDPTQILDEITKTARLQQKYLGYMRVLKAQKKMAEQKLARIRREKIDYYRGRAEKPYPVKIVAGECDTYVNADEEIQKVEMEVEAHGFSVWYLEKVIKQIESRSWDVRAAADWIKYEGGR